MIENPQAVSFANEVVRPTANKVFEAFMAATTMIAEYNARPELAEQYAQEKGTLEIDDGAARDGRPIITGIDVMSFVIGINEILEDWNVENPTKLRQILRIKTRG